MGGTAETAGACLCSARMGGRMPACLCCLQLYGASSSALTLAPLPSAPLPLCPAVTLVLPVTARQEGQGACRRLTGGGVAA